MSVCVPIFTFVSEAVIYLYYNLFNILASYTVLSYHKHPKLLLNYVTCSIFNAQLATVKLIIELTRGVEYKISAPIIIKKFTRKMIGCNKT
jgi:hypothetical protein